jgi:hypothetical protein
MPGRKRIATTALAPLIAALIGAAPAQGAADRADFVRQVDPICHAEQSQSAKLLDRAKPRNRSRANAYSEIARRGRAAIKRIYTIGPSPQSTELVLFDRWIQKLQLENELVEQVADALRNGQTRRAETLYRDAADANTRAEHVIRGYGFRYCDDSTVGSP